MFFHYKSFSAYYFIKHKRMKTKKVGKYNNKKKTRKGKYGKTQMTICT